MQRNAEEKLKILKQHKRFDVKVKSYEKHKEKYKKVRQKAENKETKFSSFNHLNCVQF